MTDTTQTPTAEQPADQAAPEQPTAPESHAAPENPYAAPRQVSDAAPASQQSNGFSIASFVLGIVSIPTGWFAAGILAIIFGFLARSREPQGRTMSAWGIALGFVGTFGWLIFAILGFLIAAPFALWGMGFGWSNGFLGY